MKLFSLLTILILLNSLESYSKLGHINASLKKIEIDSNGYYAYITSYNNGKYIGLSGSSADYPNCVAFSSDYGDTWKKIDWFDMPDFGFQYQKYLIDFKDSYFIDTNHLMVFSDKNKYIMYNLNSSYKEEFLLRNNLSIEVGGFYDYILSEKIDSEYYIYSRINGLIDAYNDKSSITIFNPETFSRKIINFDMEQFHELTEAREGRTQPPNYDDVFLTKDKCFFATIINYIDIGEKYPVQVRSLVKIADLDNPQWEVINLRFTDATAKHFIYFDDAKNGYLSTYESYYHFYPRIYHTTDGGNTWEKIYEDNESQYVPRNFKRVNDSTLFATSGSLNIYRTTDNGYTWNRLDYEEINGGIITDYEIIDENTILVAYDENTVAKITIDTKNGIIGGDDIAESGISISPQPAFTEVKLKIDKSIFNMLNLEDITIYNIIGEKIINPKIVINNSNIVTWDCSTTPAGIYLINIKHGTESKSVKVVVE